MKLGPVYSSFPYFSTCISDHHPHQLIFFTNSINLSDCLFFFFSTAQFGFFRRNTVAKMKKKLNEEADDKQEIKDEEKDEPMMT